MKCELFDNNEFLWGFKFSFDKNTDTSIKKYSVETVLHIITKECQSAEIIREKSNLHYPCIFVKINREYWHYFASEEAAEAVRDDILHSLQRK